MPAERLPEPSLRSNGNARGRTTMTKWEYLCISPREVWAVSDDGWMDNLGANGWELVSVDNGIAYFRRPKTDIQVHIGPSEHKAPSSGPSV